MFSCFQFHWFLFFFLLFLLLLTLHLFCFSVSSFLLWKLRLLILDISFLMYVLGAIKFPLYILLSLHPISLISSIFIKLEINFILRALLWSMSYLEMCCIFSIFICNLILLCSESILITHGEWCCWIHGLWRRRFNSGTKDRSQSLRALCAKFYLKWQDRESFWHRHQKWAGEYLPH